MGQEPERSALPNLAAPRTTRGRFLKVPTARLPPDPWSRDVPEVGGGREEGENPFIGFDLNLTRCVAHSASQVLFKRTPTVF